MRLFKNPTIDFLKYKGWAISGTVGLALLGTAVLVAKGGPKWGVDFTGGAQLVYGFSQPPDENHIRRIVEAAKVNVTSVQRYDKAEKNEVLLRVPMEKKEGRDVGREVQAALTAALFPKGLEPGAFDLNLNGADPLAAKLLADDPERLATKPSADPKVEYGRIAADIIGERSRRGIFASVDAAANAPRLSPVVQQWLREKAVAGPFTVLNVESVGPQVGRDLRQRGIWAVLFSWLAMLAYIGFRFRSASFGTAAVVALIHDTWITLGFCAVFGVEISLTVVAAFLTLIGYSVNDTVVVYDRIRENREKSRREPLDQLVNRSINETLSRTVITSGLTFLVVVSLFLFGGEVLRGFSFVMLVGIVVGTYSSIYVASPLVISWEGWKARKAALTPAAAASKGRTPKTR